MDVVKTFAIYIAAAIGELGGTYCYWRWLKEKGPGWLPALGILAPLGYAVIQTSPAGEQIRPRLRGLRRHLPGRSDAVRLAD